MSLRVAEDPMREFPNFSWFGTHRSVLPCKSPCGSSGRMVFFLGFSWSGKCDSRERKRVGALKVRYPREPASRGMSPSAGNRRTGSTVAQHDGRVLGEKIGKTHCARLDELAKWLVIMPRVEFLQ